MPYLVQCNSCGASRLINSAHNADAEVECDCCKEEHNHAEHVRQTGDARCRPITITALGVSSHLRADF
jgi:hypothetical protein